jgi:protocatechuate 3,4-dioxygenase beta subunit
VTLSAGLLGALATTSAAARGLPRDLIAATLEAARCGPVPRIAALVQGASSKVLAGKTALALAVVLVALIPLGTGLGQRGGAGERPDPKKADPPPPVAKQEPDPLRGRVLSPDGKPLAGAKLLLIGGDVPKELGATDAGGRFSVAVPPGSDGCYLVAQSSELGLDFAHIGGLAPKAEPELRLVADHPIRGRVIDTEGKPVAGAWVKADQFGAFKAGSLDPLLEEWKKLDSFKGRPFGDRTIWSGIGTLFTTETDKDGRFEFRGVGAERFLVMRVGKAGFTEREACIANRKGLDAKAYNVSAASTWTLYGPEPTTIVEREKLVRGRVTDSATGKPLAGVHVILSRREGGDLVRLPVGAWTDKDGNYEIRGARKAGGYMVEAKSDSATGHMACQGSSGDTPGYDPVVINLQVKKGVVITGRMIDKSTGEAVVGFAMAGVLSDNPFAKEFPSFDSSAWFRLHETDKNGRFRVVAIPGPVILMGGPNSWDEINKFKRPVNDPKYPKYFPKDPKLGGVYYTTGGAITPIQGSFGKVLEIKADATEVEHDIELEPANALAVKVQDADGKPVAGALVAGLGIRAGAKPRRCETDICEVYRLEPDKPRLVVFYDAERKLAGSINLKGSERDPVVRLTPMGSAKGRLTSVKGRPVAGDIIEVRYADANAREMHGVIHKETRIVTDKAGAFTINGLVAGVDFHLWHKRDQSEQRLSGESHRVKAGESLEFGDVKLPAARDGE